MSALRGLGLLARFQARGVMEFPATRTAFFGSLAPLVAFPLVSTVFMVLSGQWGAVLASVPVTLVAVLAPAVVSHFLARAFGRDAYWLRYAVALNWLQGAFQVPALLVVVWVVLTIANGVPGDLILPQIVLLVLLVYMLAQFWFLARVALALRGWMAVLFVILLNAVIAALVFGPQIVARVLHLAAGG